MTNQLITYRLPIDYSLISLMSLMSSISYAWIPGGRGEGGGGGGGWGVTLLLCVFLGRGVPQGL